MIFVVVYAINYIRNKYVHGFYWSKEISIFYKEEDDTIDYTVVLGVFLMSLCKFLVSV